MLSLDKNPQNNKIKSFVSDKASNRPVLFTLGTTLGAAAIGGAMGYVLPVAEDAFVKESVCNKADKLLDDVHSAYSLSENLKHDAEGGLEKAKEFVKNYDNKLAINNKRAVNTSLDKIGSDIMVKLRILLGKEAVGKIGSEIHNDNMLKAGNEMLSVIAKEERGKLKDSIKKEFLEVKEGKIPRPKNYDEIFKAIKKGNAKALAFVLGFTTAVVAGCYSKAKHNKQDKLS